MASDRDIVATLEQRHHRHPHHAAAEEGAAQRLDARHASAQPGPAARWSARRSRCASCRRARTSPRPSRGRSRSPRARAIEAMPDGLHRGGRCHGRHRRRHLRRHPVRAHAASAAWRRWSPTACVRDVAGVRATGLPVWCQGAAAPPSVAGLTFVNWGEPIGCGGVAVFPDDWVVVDDDGAVLIPAALIDEIVADGARAGAPRGLDHVRGGKGRFPPGPVPAQRGEQGALREDPGTMKLAADARGVYVIAPTPFHPDGRIDESSIDRMTDFFLAGGRHGHDGAGPAGRGAEDGARRVGRRS